MARLRELRACGPGEGKLPRVRPMTEEERTGEVLRRVLLPELDSIDRHEKRAFGAWLRCWRRLADALKRQPRLHMMAR
jgi:hypothetical protein